MLTASRRWTGGSKGTAGAPRIMLVTSANLHRLGPHASSRTKVNATGAIYCSSPIDDSSAMVVAQLKLLLADRPAIVKGDAWSHPEPPPRNAARHAIPSKSVLSSPPHRWLRGTASLFADLISGDRVVCPEKQRRAMALGTSGLVGFRLCRNQAVAYPLIDDR